MNFDFDLPAKALFRAMPICRENTRFNIDGVLIDPDPNGGAWLVATDGKGMLVQYDPDTKVPEKCVVKVSAAWLTETRFDYDMSLIGDLNDIHWCDTRLEFSKDTMTAMSSDFDIAHCLAEAGPDVFCQIRYNPISFPDWRKALDTSANTSELARPVERQTALDTGYLTDLIGWSRGFQVNPAPAGHARLISFVGEPNTFAVLMPMVADATDPLPPLLERAGRADLIQGPQRAAE
ncbi:hypothetical protein TM1040_1640 [Ruegeria sp. TM1040]|uniref:hypothetical protein n=1 Tax=Ruegeria sp. (strain TM1040) TaxID=292414 RepID=UPI0000462384|nr:hypothetical protein [Ruegeria sp. TM1040]ABF64373.1 hypothetical protein TM1040_1640 [Ruegeria sp. TM1040]